MGEDRNGRAAAGRVGLLRRPGPVPLAARLLLPTPSEALDLPPRPPPPPPRPRRRQRAVVCCVGEAERVCQAAGAAGGGGGPPKEGGHDRWVGGCALTAPWPGGALGLTAPMGGWWVLPPTPRGVGTVGWGVGAASVQGGGGERQAASGEVPPLSCPRVAPLESLGWLPSCPPLEQAARSFWRRALWRRTTRGRQVGSGQARGPLAAHGGPGHPPPCLRLPARPPGCLPACLPACPPACPPACLPACLPARPSVRMPTCMAAPPTPASLLTGCLPPACRCH